MNRFAIIVLMMIGPSVQPAPAQLIIGFNAGIPRMWDVNPSTGAAVPMLNTTQYVNGMAASPEGDIFISNFDGLSRMRYGIAQEPVIIDEIHSIQDADLGIAGLAYGNGVLYGIQTMVQSSDGIYKIDVNTAAAEKLCNYSQLNRIGGLDFNTADNRLYALVSENNIGGLYRVNLPSSLNDCSFTLVTLTPTTGGVPRRDYRGLAIGDGRAYFVPEVPGPIHVYNFATGLFEAAITNPHLYSTFSNGAAFVPEPATAAMFLFVCLSLQRRGRAEKNVNA